MIERISGGRTDLVFEYVAAGHPASAKDRQGVSLIQSCAYYGDVSAIRFLLAQGESLASLGDNLDLNGAAFHGHWPLCQFLLEHGADVNRPLPQTGETPLHAAVVGAAHPPHERVVRVLLACGATPDAATRPGVETGCFMRDCRTRGETALHRAAALASAETVRMLLDAGATVDAKDAQGDTALSWASWHGRPDAILRMLCYGPHSIHPDRNSTADRGQGWGAMRAYLLGEPRFSEGCDPSLSRE